MTDTYENVARLVAAEMDAFQQTAETIDKLVRALPAHLAAMAKTARTLQAIDEQYRDIASTITNGIRSHVAAQLRAAGVVIASDNASDDRPLADLARNISQRARAIEAAQGAR